ncbi:unnamed protein product [Allacma fusca]|uniref:Uncharacterized protein n=1 Tax=Allacma fusca TaxID=39272 RepID=A0A8J2LIB2_9HEXA|nr:unnamed protein product [Allacma fusca]
MPGECVYTDGGNWHEIKLLILEMKTFSDDKSSGGYHDKVVLCLEAIYETGEGDPPRQYSINPLMRKDKELAIDNDNMLGRIQQPYIFIWVNNSPRRRLLSRGKS